MGSARRLSGGGRWPGRNHHARSQYREDHGSERRGSGSLDLVVPEAEDGWRTHLLLGYAGSVHDGVQRVQESRHALSSLAVRVAAALAGANASAILGARTPEADEGTRSPPLPSRSVPFSSGLARSHLASEPGAISDAATPVSAAPRPADRSSGAAPSRRVACACWADEPRQP